jgi:transcriptional regulator with XRE-family HTH domain
MCKLTKLTLMETLGAFIDRLREERDLSLRELARRVGCTAPFLSDVIRGRRFPSGDMTKELARALEVPETELRSRDQRPPIEDIKRRSQLDPQLALAFRTVMERNITGKDLLEWLDKRRSSPPAKK